MSPRNRVGRPTTPGKEGEKSTLSLRASHDLKARLLTAAAHNDRSLSAEIELRLEQSFRDDRVMAALERIEASIGAPKAQTEAVGDPSAYAISEYFSIQPEDVGKLFYSSAIYRTDLKTQPMAVVIKPSVGD